MAAKIISPVGVNTDTEYATADAPFAVGTRAYGADGSEWIFAENIALVAGDVVAVSQTSYKVAKLTKTLADKGDKIAVSQATKTAAHFGWFLVKSGSGTSYTVRARNACAINVPLYTSAVAGMLDDTASSQTQVHGITLRDTATSSGAAEEAYISVDPVV